MKKTDTQKEGQMLSKTMGVSEDPGQEATIQKQSAGTPAGVKARRKEPTACSLFRVLVFEPSPTGN